MSYIEKKVSDTDQKIKIQGTHIFSTESDTVSLCMPDRRFKVKLFSGTGGGQFLIEAPEPIYLILPSLGNYTNIRLSDATEFNFKRI